MKTGFIAVLVLAAWKTVVLAMHHMEDDNILAFVGDMLSILLYIVAIAVMWFFF